MQSNQLHVDLETLDTEHTAKILSIGAVMGTETFYCEVAQGEYPDMIFTESKETREWWDGQGGFTPSVEADSPSQCIHSFAVFCGRVMANENDVEVWANSPSFDCDILAHHFKYYGINQPWKFYQEQDVRTIKRLARRLKLGVDMKANDHNALRDAQNQQRFVDRVTMKLANLCDVARTHLESSYELDEMEREFGQGTPDGS